MCVERCDHNKRWAFVQIFVLLSSSRLIEQLSWQIILACKSSSTDFLLGQKNCVGFVIL